MRPRSLLLLLLLPLLLWSVAAGASASFDGFERKPAEIAPKTLSGTIGIARISYERLGSLRSSGKPGSDEKSDLKSLRPISVSGFDAAIEPGSVLSFPVRTVTKDAVEIIVDPAEGRTAWMSWGEAKPPRDLRSLSMQGWWIGTFDSLDGFPSYVGLYLLRGWNRRKLYDEPRWDAPYEVIQRCSTYAPEIAFEWDRFRAVELEGNWLRVQERTATGAEPQEEIASGVEGWIPIRDKEGLLTVWPHTGGDMPFPQTFDGGCTPQKETTSSPNP